MNQNNKTNLPNLDIRLTEGILGPENKQLEEEQQEDGSLYMKQ